MEVIDSGSSNLIAAMCDEVRLVETIDGMVKWDSSRCDTSPGQRVKAMIINILDDRKALYRVCQYYEKKDMELLFGEPIEPAKFNDFALARALDKLYETGA
jgi:transposase